MVLSYLSASLSDAEELVAIRIEAMRESLERIGRFSPERARERFLSTFSPSDTEFILVHGIKAGFVVVKSEADCLLLDHLYMLPEFQNKGIGSQVLTRVCKEAEQANLPIKVGALKESASNRFYLSHGFVQVDESDWDNYYIWPTSHSVEHERP